MEVTNIKIRNNLKPLNLKNDIVFKSLFAKRGNEIFLKSFLSNLLNINISTISICKDNSLDVNFIKDKIGILDIKAVIDNNKIINIEMQINNYHNIIKRGMFYYSKLITNQLTKGSDYSSIKDTIVIIIADFNIFEYDDYITETITVPRNHKDYEIKGLQKFYYIELPKYRKSKKDLNNVTNQWLEFIDGEDKKGVEIAMAKNAIIEKANEELEYLTGEESIRRTKELQEKYEFDWNSSMNWSHNEGIQKGINMGKKEGLKEGKKEGLKEGIKEGEQRGISKIIKFMQASNMDIKTISKLTGLSEKEIKNLK